MLSRASGSSTPSRTRTPPPWGCARAPIVLRGAKEECAAAVPQPHSARHTRGPLGILSRQRPFSELCGRGVCRAAISLWPQSVYGLAPRCSGHYDLDDCSYCEPGWTGPSCTTRLSASSQRRRSLSRLDDAALAAFKRASGRFVSVSPALEWTHASSGPAWAYGGEKNADVCSGAPTGPHLGDKADLGETAPWLLPWHRPFIASADAVLRAIDPDAPGLHYWRCVPSS